jgi:4-carboxymuconolactone decarboxylase
VRRFPPVSSFPGRVPPLSAKDLPTEQREALGGWEELSFTQVLLRHPRMYRSFVPHMGALVNQTELPVRDRQIVILRMLTLCGDTYETAHHLVISREVGLSEPEIDAALAGAGPRLSGSEHALLRATEELHRDQCIGDETWAALGAAYTLEQRMELVFLAGCFQTVAMLTKTFGIELEPDLERFTRLREQQAR